MATCQECREDVDELQTMKVGGKNRRLCEDCAQEAVEADELSAAAESAMRGVMEYKGR